MSSTRTPSFWFVFIVKRNRQHMGIAGELGGKVRSDLCRLPLGELGNLFFQVTCVTDWRKNVYYFHIFPSLDSPSRLYYRQNAIFLNTWDRAVYRQVCRCLEETKRPVTRAQAYTFNFPRTCTCINLASYEPRSFFHKCRSLVANW